MEQEISIAAKLGIVLIALAIVISLGFGAFMITRSTTNDGQEQVTNSLQDVKDSKLMDYNNRKIYGSQLKSFISQNIEFVEAGILVEVYNTDYQFAEKGYSIKIDDKYYVNWGRIIRPLDVEPMLSTAGKYVTNRPNEMTIDNMEISGYFYSNESGPIRKISQGYLTENSAEYISDKIHYEGHLIKDAAGEYIGLIFNKSN